MHRLLKSVVAIVAAVGPMGVVVAQQQAGAGTQAVAAAPDYSKDASWVCRPGHDVPCTQGLDTTIEHMDGTTTVVPFHAAADAPIDCFYVYPTVSKEPGEFADMTLSPEIAKTANAQVGHLSAKCRVFAPIYRQVTMAGLMQHLMSGGQADFKPPVQDVAAAIRYYFEHDNHGRGVVFVGHSQGTIILQSILARGFDGKPAAERMVSAFLAGDPSLAVPEGKRVGGTFAHIPTCAAAAQTGCVYVWGSYEDGDETPEQKFGHPMGAGQMSACDAPSAPGGGVAVLKSIFPRAADEAGTITTPYIELDGELRGGCRAQASGNALRVTVVPGAGAAREKALLDKAQIAPGWGLHILDMGLMQANILDVLDAESAAWAAAHRAGDDADAVSKAPQRQRN